MSGAHGRNYWHPRVLVKALLCRFLLLIEFCHDCGVRQPLVWYSSDALWSRVAGESGGAGVLCPKCFDRRAAKQGMLLQWIPREVHAHD